MSSSRRRALAATLTAAVVAGLGSVAITSALAAAPRAARSSTAVKPSTTGLARTAVVRERRDGSHRRLVARPLVATRAATAATRSAADARTVVIRERRNGGDRRIVARRSVRVTAIHRSSAR